MNSQHQPRIWLRRPEVPSTVDVVELKFGGISLYSDDKVGLEAYVSHVLSVLLDQSREHLTLAAPILRNRMRVAGLDIEARIFSAILGYGLRMGSLDALLCLSSAHNPFRVFVHATNLDTLTEMLAFTAARLSEDRQVAIAALRKELFPGKEWGSWSHCSALLARLAYLGVAKQLDENTFQFNPQLEHALCDPGWLFTTADLSGVVPRSQTPV